MLDPNNPRAFPSAAIDGRFGGMSLVDWFAGQALAGFAASPAALNKWHDGTVARCAYEVSAAMLAERAKRMDADPFSPDALSSAARKLHRAGHLTDSDMARICNRIDAAERVREGMDHG